MSKKVVAKYYLVSIYCDLVLARDEQSAINFIARRDRQDPKGLCAQEVALNIPTKAQCKPLKSTEYEPDPSDDDESEESDEE